MLALLACFFLVCYLLLVPGRQQVRDLVPAALVCAVGWTVLQGIGSWFVARQVAHWSALYGTIATVFGVLLFLRIAAWIFLAGAELAATLPRRPRAGGATRSERHGPAWNDEPMADGKTSRATLETHEPPWRGEGESSRRTSLDIAG